MQRLIVIAAAGVFIAATVMMSLAISYGWPCFSAAMCFGCRALKAASSGYLRLSVRPLLLRC